MKHVLMIIIAILGCAVANAQYKVGDIYNNDGIKGIVVKVDNSGQHGLIMSLDKFSGKWYNDKKAKFLTDAFYEDDGEKNMAVIERYLSDNGQTWDKFPFFEWCRNKGAGWYAPALEEMNAIITAMNGSVGKYSVSNMEAFDKIIKDNGGESLYGNTKLPMGGNMPYSMLTSTEANKGKVYTGAFFQTSPFGTPDAKTFEMSKTHGKYLGSRAIHKF
ncbi:MAG: hypothetical protein J6B44_09395 [Muribaculaceae bacterium]|nr:hypothetical protein [Muribaculaceae bacterium]